jgi:hypothetical protein
VDGFVLDLNWFGGIVLNDPAKSTMGRLDWDADQTPKLAANPYSFPDPAAKVAAHAGDHVGLTAIEESYLASTTDTFTAMPGHLMAYERTTDGGCDPARQDQPVSDPSGFWGIGRMIDWSDPAAGPKNGHSDVHNLYNLLWKRRSGTATSRSGARTATGRRATRGRSS